MSALHRAPSAALLALALCLAPALARACPACAADNGSDPAVLAAIGAFLLVPFALVALCVLAARALPSPPGERA